VLEDGKKVGSLNFSTAAGEKGPATVSLKSALRLSPGRLYELMLVRDQNVVVRRAANCQGSSGGVKFGVSWQDQGLTDEREGEFHGLLILV
jgi:hypothetical protein